MEITLLGTQTCLVLRTEIKTRNIAVNKLCRSITPLIYVINLAAGGRCAQYKSVLCVVAGLCFAA